MDKSSYTCLFNRLENADERPSRFWVVTCLTLRIACITATSATAGEPAIIPRLTVRGNAILQVPADQMQMRVGVTTKKVIDSIP
jgi:uncharacterized protein YggE